MSDNRKPILEKIGCYFWSGDGTFGYHFFEETDVLDGDVFVHRKGVLWRLKRE